MLEEIFLCSILNYKPLTRPMNMLYLGSKVKSVSYTLNQNTPDGSRVCFFVGRNSNSGQISLILFLFLSILKLSPWSIFSRLIWSRISVPPLCLVFFTIVNHAITFPVSSIFIPSIGRVRWATRCCESSSR